jgi:hypothetical protein
MKLSNETLSILKNFGAINPGILFKKGKKLRTVSSQRNILAEVDLTDEIPAEFGVYDLNNFLSILSLHKDDPSFEFDDKQIIISGNKGRSKIKYRFCAPNMIVTPPEKAITMPDPEIKFSLSSEDFEWILRVASVLGSPHIAVESDGKKVNIVTFDGTNDSASTESLEIADGDGSSYKILFKTENITKMMNGSYDVLISSKGIGYFKHQTINLQYWISTETGSQVQK